MAMGLWSNFSERRQVYPAIGRKGIKVYPLLIPVKPLG